MLPAVMKPSSLVDVVVCKPLLDRKALARLFNRSLRTIDRWRREGRLPPGKAIHGRMWTPVEIERWIRSGGLPDAA